MSTVYSPVVAGSLAEKSHTLLPRRFLPLLPRRPLHSGLHTGTDRSRLVDRGAVQALPEICTTSKPNQTGTDRSTHADPLTNANTKTGVCTHALRHCNDSFVIAPYPPHETVATVACTY